MTDKSDKELCDKRHSIRSVTLSLLKDTNWPPESTVAANSLLQSINDLPDVPSDASATTFKDTVLEFIRILEEVHTRVEEASEKYGKERLLNAIKDKLSTQRHRRCTDTLWGCRAEIENVSTKLRDGLKELLNQGNATTGPARDSETPSEIQPKSSMPLIGVDHPSEPLEQSKSSPAGLANQTVASGHQTGQPTSLQNSPPDPAESGERRSSARNGILIAARKTFETVEAVSGAIPGVGAYVGVAAKVGLAFVNMIKTMDENEEVAKELTSHTSNLSSYLEHFEKKLKADQGDEVAGHIEGLRSELKSVQEKVNTWMSSGRFKRAFLASEHADELKAHQDAVQTALEEMQARGTFAALLISLKATDLVVELKDTVLRAERTRLLDRLGDGSYGARGNAVEDVICLPGTRVEILRLIDEWIRGSANSENRVLWIRGMAGRGKSTIASTVAHHWASKGSCAIFHFRRGQNELDGQFICALARQLGRDLVPEVKDAILDCVRQNEDVAKERLEQQFKKLFVGSFGNIQHSSNPIIIIVDALDECRSVDDAVRFVRLIDQNSQSLPGNVKFLLTCRPEPPLVLALELRKWRAEDLDSLSRVDEDIRRFIQHACAEIRGAHEELPETWPSSTDLEAIVKMSQGLFQWARTAITYISNRSPDDRIQDLLRDSSKWGGLDELYHQILSRAFKEVQKDPMRKQLLSWVLGTLVVAPYPVTLEILAFLYADHKAFIGRADAIKFLRNDILADLNSLLHIPKSSSEPVRLMHTSIRDLLTADERCGTQDYFVEPVQDHRRLARISLQIMGRDLKQNICKTRFPKANSEIENAINSHVPPGLGYCCCSWSTHLTTGVPPSEAIVNTASIVPHEFKLFSDEKILFWLEVMSLIGAMTEAYNMSKQVHQWLVEQPISSDFINTLWKDVQRFITAFFEPISLRAFDVYAAALSCCPVGTKLWLKYQSQATAWMLAGKRGQRWSPHIWTATASSSVNTVAFSPDGTVVASGSGIGAVELWDRDTGALLDDPLTSHSSAIWSIVFSPDGKVLASGSKDKTVQLWDGQTGALLGKPLTGHSDWIISVVFSPDGKVLASGSKDKTIRLWDGHTGAPLGDPLTGHSNPILSVVFSPDGKVLASGSGDNTVRLWDGQTGAPLGNPLTGHSNCITSVMFSPDGKVLASGSDDKTVRLWDGHTGVPLGDPLTGHANSIMSIVFSPDSKVLASGSSDNTVQLWDGHTGAPLGNPLTGHNRSIASVLFSPDGKVLVSASDDKTVRLWDGHTGAPLGNPLTGHSGPITSVAFSPDGKVLVSGSYDETVRSWDGQTGAPLGDPLTGHSDRITSIMFSLDGKILASGSNDKTVQLWDGHTGVPLGDPLTNHSGTIWSVAFSPDCKILASGSEDETIRLWDGQTGAPLGDPLTGHSNTIWSVVFSPDGKVLASGSSDMTVRLWDGQTGAPLGDPLTGHSDTIWSVVFSPGCKVLASGSDDETIRLWDGQTGAPLGDPLTGHSASIWCVVFSPDGKVLASGSDDKTVQLWDGQTGALLGDPLTGHRNTIMSVAFSPDGKVLASGSSDMTVQLWDGQTGAPLGDPLTGHSHSIRSVMFLPNSKVLTSTSADGMVRFWDSLALQSLMPSDHSTSWLIQAPTK